jgi:hypothetical protein
MTYLPQNKIKEYRDANKPEICPILEINFTDAVVDHNHDSGMVRGVIHRQANAWEGKVYNSWRRYAKNNCDITFVECLKNLVKYLERGDTDVLHPVGLVQLGKRFGRMTKDEQVFSLMALGVNKKLINSCKNGSERIKLYKDYLKS